MGGIITILANLGVYGLVVFIGYLVYQKYDKKLLDGNVIAKKQMLIAIIWALFASIIASSILHAINYLLLWNTNIASIVGLLILVAQFYVMYYWMIFLLQKQKIELTKKAGHLLSHKISFTIIISLVLINIAFGIAQVLLFGTV